MSIILWFFICIGLAVITLRVWAFDLKKLGLVLSGVTFAAVIAFIIGFAGLKISGNFEGTGKIYRCIPLDDGGYIAKETRFGTTRLFVSYLDSEGDVRTLDITEASHRIPIEDGVIPYVESAECRFWFFASDGAICHINVLPVQ